MESGERPNRLSAAVHEGHGLDQMDGLASHLRGRDIRLPPGLVSKSDTEACSPFVRKPEPGVVPSPGILTTRVAKSDDQLERSSCGHRTDGY
jgi:hypothetical protein